MIVRLRPETKARLEKIAEADDRYADELASQLLAVAIELAIEAGGFSAWKRDALSRLPESRSQQVQASIPIFG